jgi:hypothetical protein
MAPYAGVNPPIVTTGSRSDEVSPVGGKPTVEIIP